jgi:hypothetical protein
MADEEREERPAERSRPPRDGAGQRSRPAGGSAKRPYKPRDGDAKRPYTPRDGDAKRPYTPRDGDAKRPYKPRDGDAKRPYTPRDGGAKRPYKPRDGETARPYRARDAAGGRDAGRSTSRPPQSAERRIHDDPDIPEEITARDLNPGARNELKTLSKENAEHVARHLAMAAQLIDDDPALAHRHALAASRRAGRIAVVRETVAITAYATGDFALALRELRTFRRISGRDDQIALMVDSERGVGRPDRALEVGRAVDRSTLPTAVRVELAIALSGARLDLGEPERALLELDIPELDPNRAFEWSPALFAARANVLEELGRADEAGQWRRRAEVAEEALGGGEAAADDFVIVEEILEEDIAPDAEASDPEDPEDPETASAEEAPGEGAS